MPVVGHARHVLESRLDCGVPSDVTAAVERLSQHHVVDELGGDSGTTNGLGDGRRAELERVHVDQGSFVRGSDRGASGGDDDGVVHAARIRGRGRAGESAMASTALMSPAQFALPACVSMVATRRGGVPVTEDVRLALHQTGLM